MRHALFVVLLAGCGGGSADGPTSAVAVTTPVIFMGDSITAQMDTAACIPGSINAGIGGQTTLQMARRFQNDVIDRKPRYVVILGGTNDVRDGQMPLVGMGPLFEMADMSDRAGIIPILATIPPNSSITTAYGWGPNLVVEWNGMIKRMALGGRTQSGESYRVVDYYPLFVNPDGSQNMDLFQLNDQVHPNRAGDARMCAELKRTLGM